MIVGVRVRERRGSSKLINEVAVIRVHQIRTRVCLFQKLLPNKGQKRQELLKRLPEHCRDP